MWSRGDTKLQSELERFRTDFPNDLGFELAVVCQKMSVHKPTFTAPQDQLVLPATQALYRQWHDPFFQYVEALYALQNGQPKEADELFRKCVAAGFAPTDYYISRIESQLDQSDTSGIIATLEEWNRNLAVDGLTPDKKLLDKLASRYEALEQEINPQPSIGDRMSSSARGPFSGRGDRPGIRPGSADSGGEPLAGSNNQSRTATEGSSASSAQRGEGNMGPPPGFGRRPVLASHLRALVSHRADHLYRQVRRW